MMQQTPVVVDPTKPVGRHEQGAANLLDAIDAPFIVADDDFRLARRHRLLRCVAKNIAIGGDDRRPSDQRRPPRMHAGDAVLRPERLHRDKIPRGEGAVVKFIGGAQGALGHSIVMHVVKSDAVARF